MQMRRLVALWGWAALCVCGVARGDTVVGGSFVTGSTAGAGSACAVQSSVGQVFAGLGSGSAPVRVGSGFCYLLGRYAPPVEVYRDDVFTTGEVRPPGVADGWSSFGFQNELAWADYDTTGQTYRGHVVADGTRFRIAGVSANVAEWLPYSLVGPDRLVRSKFYVYAGGQADPGDLNQIPNLRLRLSNRFAVNSMLEVFHHDPTDPGNAALARELRPSSDPANPSIYRVDFDPVDVPYLMSNAGFEGVQRGFEAYAIHPMDNGFLALTESVIGTYDAGLGTSPTAAVKTYATDVFGAGDLAAFVPAAELTLYKIVPGTGPGEFGTVEATTPLPGYYETAAGVTLVTVGIPTDRIGVATRNFNPDANTFDFASRTRVEEGKQYAVRFHMTSTQQVNRQAQIRLRARSVKFGWSQKFEVGGAWATDGGKTYPLNANNSIAQQSLPGAGCQNPDQQTPGEDGGWYTMLMHTPMSADIRPEFPSGTPLATRMPNIAAQAGPGVNAFSRRDLLFGMDLVDSLSAGAGRFLEEGIVTLDRIEVRAYDRVPD